MSRDPTMARRPWRGDDPQLPAAPFRAWLQQQLREYTLSELAANTGVNESTLGKVVADGGKKHVQRYVVDRVMTRAGAHIDQIDWDADVPKAKPARRKLEPPCPCRCGQRGICEEHRQRLADIRKRQVPRAFYTGSGFPDELKDDAA